MCTHTHIHVSLDDQDLVAQDVREEKRCCRKPFILCWSTDRSHDGCLFCNKGNLCETPLYKHWTIFIVGKFAGASFHWNLSRRSFHGFCLFHLLVWPTPLHTDSQFHGFHFHCSRLVSENHENLSHAKNFHYALVQVIQWWTAQWVMVYVYSNDQAIV